MATRQNLRARKNLDLPPGHWQLFSYGRLTSVPTIKQAIWITAFFRRVIVDSDAAVMEWTQEITSQAIPVGELVAWEIGCVFDAAHFNVSRPQPLSKRMSVIDVDVAFTDANCRLMRRNHQEEGARRPAFYRSPLSSDNPEANVYLLRVDRGNDVPLLIPCTTILQSFWGRSSNLVQMLLDSRFLDFDGYVVSTERSSLDKKTGHALLWLRQWSLDSDAKFLATLAFNATAVRRGQDISARLHAAVSANSGIPSRCICAYPPYDTPMTLQVLGCEVGTPGGRYFYVQRVLASNYTPPFSKVTFDRDNDGRKALTDEINTFAENGTPVKEHAPMVRDQNGHPISAPLTEYELAQDHPSSASAVHAAHVGSFDEIFSKIACVPAEKLEQLETKYKNASALDTIKKRRWAELSALVGVSSASSEILQAVLVPNTVPDAPFDNSIAAVGQPLDALLRQLISLERTGSRKLSVSPGAADIHFEFEYVFPWIPSAVHNGHRVFSLPEQSEGYPYAWLYRDPDQEQRKRGLCLRITFFDSESFPICAGYLVELEGRFVKTRSQTDLDTENASDQRESIDRKSKDRVDSPLLFIWRWDSDRNAADHSTTIGRDELRTLILRLVKGGGALASETAWAKGIRSHVRRHSSAELLQLLEELKWHIESPVNR